jgi:hypothetical protein
MMRSNEPRLVVHAGCVRIFYAEQLPGEKWRHWQRILGPAGTPAESASSRRP